MQDLKPPSFIVTKKKLKAAGDVNGRIVLAEKPSCHFTWVGNMGRSFHRALAHQVRGQLHKPVIGD